MSDERKPTIADDERSPASEAADAVPFGPGGTKPEDESRPEPPGAAEAPAADDDAKPAVPPARSHH